MLPKSTVGRLPKIKYLGYMLKFTLLSSYAS